MNFPLEALELEALRQRIETAENEAGSLSDYLDRGQAGPPPVPNPARRIDELGRLAETWKRDLAATAAQHPAAVAVWAAFHIDALTAIATAPAGDASAHTRKFVARQAIDAWQNVRNGQQSYVSINWYYLADYQKALRGLLG